jgi:hypothetical protein
MCRLSSTCLGAPVWLAQYAIKFPGSAVMRLQALRLTEGRQECDSHYSHIVDSKILLVRHSSV